MKLRYYMRGLGIGILVTAILMGVSLEGKTEKLTDAEIIERAEALGMEQKYESTVLADTVSENEAEDENEAVKENETELIEPDVPEDEVQEIETDVTEEVQEIETDVTGEEVQEIETDVPEEIQEITETVQITVQGGDGSQTVARKLKDAGVIDDVVAYDKYLCKNGYDKRICTGTHTIPVGASDEEIAKIITTRAR